MLKCKYCGWDLPEDARICTYCGHPVEPEDDEQKRRLKLKWHLRALVVGMSAPKSAFLLSTAKTSSARAPAALVVFLISTLVLANIVVIGALHPHAIPSPTAFTFTPHTSVNPSLIDFGMVEIGSKAVMPVLIKTSDTSQFRLEVVSANAQWLTITLQSETKEHNNLRDIIYDVTANTSTLQVGQYSVTLAIKSGGGPPQQVPVKIQVTPHRSPLPPELHISPQLLDFGAQNVGSQAMLPLTVSNNGGQKLDWSADKGQIPWLTLDTSSGNITPGGHPHIINVRVDTTTLTKGQRSASIHFTSNGGHVSVKVVLNVVLITVNGPAVSNITPGSGPEVGGTPVTITGSGFTGVTGVSFGSSPATRVSFISDAQITAISPAGTGIVDVTVTTPNGTSTSSSADLFAYLPPPTVTGINPNSGSEAGGTLVNIAGSAFGSSTNGVSVSFGGTPATITSLSNIQITAVSPAGTGIVHVTVTTPYGASVPSSVDQFTYHHPTIPTVTNVSPNQGKITGGTNVTISGTDFTNATVVSFGRVSVASGGFTVKSDTTIYIVSPAWVAYVCAAACNMMVVDVTVTNPVGTSAISHADEFTYYPPPTAKGIYPNSGSAAGGTPVTIAGSGFGLTTNGVSVSFGGTPATITSVSDTQIMAVSPAGTGTVDVTVTTPGGTSNAVQFTYIPIVTRIDPSSGPAAGGTKVTITGSGFTGVTQVSFGQIAGTKVTFISDTQITAVSPAGTGIADVTVTTPSGTSNAVQFTYIPIVTRIDPNSGPAAGGQINMFITGIGFTGATKVSFGSNSAEFAVINDRQIRVYYFPGGSGTVGVTVTTAMGTSNAVQFTYIPPPTVTGIDPYRGSAAGGTLVTITGSGFTGVTGVSFASSPATQVTFISDTQIMAVSPAWVVQVCPAACNMTVDVTVTTPGGTSAANYDDQFSYQ